jgi:transcriptional antiterminator NusG
VHPKTGADQRLSSLGANNTMLIKRWYAIRTQSRAERMVRDALTHQAIESFLPLMTRVSQWKGRHKRIQRALFSGYCFAKLSLTERPLVAQAPGVVDIINAEDGRPIAIPDEEIGAIRRVIDCGQRYQADLGLEEGTRVEVMRGPLAGIQGKLVQKAGKSHVAVFIDIIGQGISVEMDAEDTAIVYSSFKDGEKATG